MMQNTHPPPKHFTTTQHAMLAQVRSKMSEPFLLLLQFFRAKDWRHEDVKMLIFITLFVFLLS